MTKIVCPACNGVMFDVETLTLCCPVKCRQCKGLGVVDGPDEREPVPGAVVAPAAGAVVAPAASRPPHPQDAEPRWGWSPYASTLYSASPPERMAAASDVFFGATSQADVNARLGDFVFFIEEFGGVVDARGTATYDPTLRPCVRLSGWSIRKVRDDRRLFASISTST